jgi:hypothetical protein
MSDFNTMLRDQARNGLQAQLDVAVTNGDAEAARKVTSDLEKLAVSTAPKAPPFNDTDIRAELDKQPWFGTDPKKSAKVVEFGKTLDPKKFATAAAFAEALVKAVDAEFTPPAAVADPDADPDADAEDADDDAEAEDGKKPAKKRASDSPGEADAVGRSRRPSGPWAKLSDAPADVQKEIKRTADRFVSSTAPKEQREKFIANALAAQYARFQIAKGKK